MWTSFNFIFYHNFQWQYSSPSNGFSTIYLITVEYLVFFKLWLLLTALWRICAHMHLFVHLLFLRTVLLKYFTRVEQTSTHNQLRGRGTNDFLQLQGFESHDLFQEFRDFPGGPMVKTPSSQCRGHGFDWSLVRKLISRMPRGAAKINNNKNK